MSIRLAIDASNIRLGGGVTHLSQLLAAADPAAAGIDRVTVWAPAATLAALPQRPWLGVRSPAWVQASLPRRSFGQQWGLPDDLIAERCTVLFSPGGTLPRRCPIPAVTMSQNMLPFEPAEALRFGRASLMRLKLRILRVTQGRSFRQADGVIFLTRYAQDAVTAALGGLPGRTALIPHGVEERFFRPPRKMRTLAECSAAQPFRVLYVSILMPYKHQIEVAQAVDRLRCAGLPIEIRFVGALWGNYGAAVRAACRRLDPAGEFLHLSGAMPFSELHGLYGAADAFVFASSCENLPNILVEAMAAGLPIVCADRGPMREVLGNAGTYCDPESPDSIAAALRGLADDAACRKELAQAAWQRARAYSWERCAADTFDFIARVARTGDR